MYGSVFTEDEVKKQLYESNRDYRGRQTWADLYSSAGTAAKRQMSALNYDYANAMSQAYLSSLSGNSAIQGLNAIQGNKQMLLDQNSSALQQAFEAYSKQHVEGAQQIAQNLGNTNAAIDSALGEQAKNTIDYANAHYSYLQRLYEDYQNGNNKIFDNVLWNKFLVDEVDEDGNVIEQRLKTWNELTSAAQDENGEWISLYNDNNELTIAGVDFFDQMENFVASTDAERAAGALSWGEYLNETNPELFKWASTQNAYDYTVGDGNNAGSFRTLVGMTSADTTYKFAERLGGLSSAQLDNLFNDFVEYGKEYSDITDKTGGGARNKRRAKDAAGMATNLQKLTDDLGITEDIEQATGVSITELVNAIINNEANMKSGWGLAGDFFSNFGAALGTSAIGGAAIGAGIGGVAAGGLAATGVLAPFAPAVEVTFATAGLAIGSIVGFVSGIVGGSIDTRKSIEANEEYENSIKNSYLDMIGALTMFAYNKKQSLNNSN